jgi:NADH-quinone oxidoreductase subunit F
METPLTQKMRPDGARLSLKEYEAAGGYQGLRKALRMTPQEVQEAVRESNLRGRGGAGFPTAQKWSFVPMGGDAPRPKYLIANADEMEPGTFKDRLLLECDPHQLIEGMIISSYAIQANVAYVFLRWAYRVAAQGVQQSIAEAYQAGYLGRNVLNTGYGLELHLHVSAGRYMCGEETALLNALEGRRANPRSKPPYPQSSGVWGKPTIVNNVETLCNVPHILDRGAAWFKALSRSHDGGTKLYGASGRVRRPGLWELPMGTPLREILEEHAGGMHDGYQLRGVLPGGASTEFLIEGQLDVPMDFDSMQKAGSRLGTGTAVVLDDRTCPVGMLHNLEQFFARESCGWCTPCWSGLSWVEELLHGFEQGQGSAGDLERLQEHTHGLGPGHTYCALAPGAMEPLQSGLKHFREDFEQHITHKRCPWK